MTPARVVSGPYDTEADTRPVTAPVYAAFDADPGVGKMAPHSLRLMLDATEAAKVELGAYDRRILQWLAGFEASACAVVAGLISRASLAAPDADHVARLEAENASLRDRVALLERRTGHLMVDADRREERARKEAESCAEHGKEIQHLRHLASWYWASEQHADQKRMAVVGAIGNAALALRHRTDSVPAAEVVRFLDKIADAQKAKARKGHPDYPTLADCLRGGGCDHDGLSDSLKAEIATALGLVTSEPVLTAHHHHLPPDTTSCKHPAPRSSQS